MYLQKYVHIKTIWSVYKQNILEDFRIFI